MTPDLVNVVLRRVPMGHANNKRLREENALHSEVVDEVMIKRLRVAEDPMEPAPELIQMTRRNAALYVFYQFYLEDGRHVSDVSYERLKQGGFNPRLCNRNTIASDLCGKELVEYVSTSVYKLTDKGLSEAEQVYTQYSK